MAAPASRLAANTDPIGSSAPLSAALRRERQKRGHDGEQARDTDEQGEHEEARVSLRLHYQPGGHEADDEEHEHVQAVESQDGSGCSAAPCRRHEPGSEVGGRGEERLPGYDVEDSVEQDDHDVPYETRDQPFRHDAGAIRLHDDLRAEAIGGARPGREP